MLLLLLLSRFSRVRLCATPKTTAHQASPSLGFSPGKNTGVGRHFLLQCMKVKSESEVAQSSTYWPHGLQPTRLRCPWDFPGKSIVVQCLLYTTCPLSDKVIIVFIIILVIITVISTDCIWKPRPCLFFWNNT